MKSDAIITALKRAAQEGVDTDDALDQLSELVDLAHQPEKENVLAKVQVILTEVPLGYQDMTCVVGWDTCGACHLRITVCTCKNGPTEPGYVKTFRASAPATASQKGAYQSSSGLRTPTAVTKENTENAAVPSSRDGISSYPQIQKCKVCNAPVSTQTADMNDDGSFTCFDCQPTLGKL